MCDGVVDKSMINLLQNVRISEPVKEIRQLVHVYLCVSVSEMETCHSLFRVLQNVRLKVALRKDLG